MKHESFDLNSKKLNCQAQYCQQHIKKLEGVAPMLLSYEKTAKTAVFSQSDDTPRQHKKVWLRIS